MSKYIKTISLFVIILIMAFMSVYSSAFAYAEEYTTIEEEVPYDYETSSVIADLNDGVEVSENLFFPQKYLRNIFTESLDSIVQGNFEFAQDIWVISFIENGYGTNKFGIYLYVYNPNNLDILTDSNKNKVQFAVCNQETAVFSSDYVKYNIVLLDKTENNKYMKFKVDGFSALQSSERYYAVSGIELHINGDTNATEYSVGSVYHCSTRNGKTTISRGNLDTINVDCTHVYYRTDDSVKGGGWSNQLSACYFSLPQAYSFGNNPYGTLSEILSEFYLYYTKPILLLNDLNVYYDFGLAYALSTSSAEFRNNQALMNLSFGAISFVQPGWENAVPHYGPYYGYFSFPNYYVSSPENKMDALYWLFCDENADFDNEDYYFPAENLESYYEIYNSYVVSLGKSMFEDRQYFEDNNVSLCGFNYGYNKHTYSISQNPEEGAVLGYNLTFNQSDFWSWLYEEFGGNAVQTITDIAPLVRVEYADLSLSDDDFSEKYLVAKQQVFDLKTKLATSETLGQEVWLFRYDCSEYYGAIAEVYDRNYSNSPFDGLVCQEPVYLDWDILSFKFEQESIDTKTQQTKTITTTVPVEHSPETVFSDLDRSDNNFFNKSGCTDYGSLFSLLLFLGGSVAVWFVISKIVNYIRRR